MLSLFRTNQFFANILLIAYVILLRGAMLLDNTYSSIKPSVQGIWSYELFERMQMAQWQMPIWAAILIFIQAVGVNFIATRFRLSEEITLFAGIFYILLTSIVVESATLSAALFANTFLIIIIHELLLVYRKSDAASSLFNIGLFIGIGSFFQASFVIFLIFGLVAISVLRSFNVKEFLQMFLGSVCIYFLVGTFYFYYDAYDTFWNIQIKNSLNWLDFRGNHTWVAYIERILFISFLVMAIVSQGFYSSKKSIPVQKYQTIIYWVLIFVGLTVFFQSQLGMEQLLLLIPTLSFFVMYHFLSLDRNMAEVLHVVLIFLAIALQLHKIIGF